MELFQEFVVPLLPERGRHDDDDPPLQFGPQLGHDQPGFDGLAEAHFVCEKRTTGNGERKAKSAASTWCGFRSTVALASDWESFSKVSAESCLVSSRASKREC